MTNLNPSRQLHESNPRSGEIDYQLGMPSAQAALNGEKEDIFTALEIDTGRPKLATMEFYALQRSIARQIDAGGVSVNDCGVTSMVFETEKNAFGYSGMGPSRVGPAGLTRFLRRKSIYVNRGVVSPQ